jgi:protein SCO1/2
MYDVDTVGSLSEMEFASLVSNLAASPTRSHQLTELLREDHPIYDQRGAATTVRMRGWILHAFCTAGLSDDALTFVLEELDTGIDPYLVAAASRALRSYPNRSPSFAPFIMRAITNIRYRDEPVSFAEYGEYAIDEMSTSPVRELLATLEWLGDAAHGVLPELEALLAQPAGLSKKLLIHVDQVVKVIRSSDEFVDTETCCTLPSGLRDRFNWSRGSTCQPIEQTLFEDHDNKLISFGEFFKGQPSIAVFFYTRCDNPLKCSLTITKLARLQNLLLERGLADQINTAAITYDPEFDVPDRIRGYGKNRGVQLGPNHRMLRARDGIETIRKHFKLGVNFIESLVNRHRVEVYILDDKGQIATVFERIHWDEQSVVDRAIELLQEKSCTDPVLTEKIEHRKFSIGNDPSVRRTTTASILATLASFAVAFFPKCPICWAAYLSVFGIAGLDQIPYSPWLQPLLATVILINLASVWLRARATGRMISFYLASAGAILIIVSKFGSSWRSAALWGVAFTFAGSILSALGSRKRREFARH